jgi:hypothetical protein
LNHSGPNTGKQEKQEKMTMGKLEKNLINFVLVAASS